MSDMETMIKREIMRFITYINSKGYIIYKDDSGQLSEDSSLITLEMIENIVLEYLRKYKSE